MRVKTAAKLAILGLAAYGGRTLWTRYGGLLGSRAGSRSQSTLDPSVRRVYERAELTVEERAVGSDDPLAQAAAILADSDERSRLPRTADGIERRRSQDTVEP
jgi:hypothetical protein